MLDLNLYFFKFGALPNVLHYITTAVNFNRSHTKI